MRRLAFALVLLLAGMVPPPAPAQAAEAEPSAASAANQSTVTLITGDRVTITRGAAGERPTVSVTPARREGGLVAFHTTYVGESVRVVPSDVAHLVGKVLDPQLFDIGAVAEVSSPSSLPLIVKGPLGFGRLRSTRVLSSIGATAVELSISDSATALSLAGMERIWLDARVKADVAEKPRWDSNLEQIEVPAAWAAGLSGAGVRVAVLDTGVDGTHPDLAGRVAAAENFTDSPVTTDLHGHGTHVASVVAGTGAAAKGQRRGVAFNATLLSGKVLGDDGSGQFSDIIAGMEWAVGQGARVVNMSLGSEAPSSGNDPVSLAVEALTASHGALFVASAGNRGPRESTIGSPGAATSALTVGAVDRRDRLADFSSRGPRLGDHAIKPEVVAPGVDIIGARAAGTDLGIPVGSRYTRLSGTSMAAPHVAGAAALLAEKYPLWTALNLKALLAGSASPIRATAFEAGVGRIDLKSALPQRLIAPQATLSFGFVAYPQAGTLQRTLRLANTGVTPVNVDLAVDGPLGMFTVSPASLAIPAGGEATATVTVAVAEGGYGPLSGTVVAQGLRVPVGVFKEHVHHLLHIRALDRLGSEKFETLAWVVNLGDITLSPPEPVLLRDGVGTARVREGFYAVTSAIPTLEEGIPDPDGTDDLIVTSIAIATKAEVLVDRETEVLLNALNAKPVSATVAGAQTVPVDLHVFVAAKDRADNGSVLAYATSAQDVIEEKLFIEPTTRARHGDLELSSKWRLDTVGGGPTYDLLFADDVFPQSIEYVAHPRELAEIRTTYRTPASPVSYLEGRFVFTAVNPVSIAVFQPIEPSQRIEHLSAGVGQRWFQCANVIVAEEGIGGYCQAASTYQRGKRVDHAWLTAPLRTRAAVFFTPTHLFIGMDELADSQHSGTISGHAFSHREFALYRNGTLIAQGVDPLGGHAIPRGPAVYQLTRKLTLRPGLLALSTSVESSWTFRTQILDVGVHAPVDASNHVPANSPITLEVSHSKARLATLSLEVSTDDGATWQAVKLHGLRGTVTLSAGPVSLRVKASDVHGNRSEQTILRAVIAT